MGRKNTTELIRTNYPLFYLTEDEIADPLLAIREFFSTAHLPEFRDMLWLSFKTNVMGSYPHGDTLTPQERCDIVVLYEQLVRLVEAAHLLNEKQLLEKAVAES